MCRCVRSVRAVNQVAADLQAKICTDGTRFCLGRVGGPHRLADDVDGISAFDHGHHDRAAGDKLDQALVKGLALVDGIVA